MCLETGLIFYNATKAYEETGVHRDSIYKCCTGKYNTAGGYHWKYITKKDYEKYKEGDTSQCS